MLWATRLIESASATEEPPYFCTTSAMGHPLLPVDACPQSMATSPR